MEDKQFTTQFLAVLGSLLAFTIIILVLANIIYGTGEERGADVRIQQSVAERIKPIGNVYVGSVPEGVAGAGGQAAAVEVAAADLSGEQVYQQVCAACHAAGVLNAPKPGDAAAWEPRLANGKDSLYANSINGIGAMPAKGGRADLADDAIKAAVDYMLE